MLHKASSSCVTL